jgi:hypothetical protein
MLTNNNVWTCCIACTYCSFIIKNIDATKYMNVYNNTYIMMNSEHTYDSSARVSYISKKNCVVWVYNACMVVCII